jgi:hypothetical protein
VWPWGLALADLAEGHGASGHSGVRGGVDILRLGHAMVRPGVGFVFSEERGTLFLAVRI